MTKKTKAKKPPKEPKIKLAKKLTREKVPSKIMSEVKAKKEVEVVVPKKSFGFLSF